MSQIQEIIDGLTIIKKYTKKHDVFCGHEVFIAGHKSDEIEKKATKEDLQALEDAGWRYLPEYEGWGHYT